jgi:uncharacterized SAM-binding protein YcdF (DUF218 family)
MGYCDECLETPNQPSSLLPGLRTWLSPADAPRSADLIFVLAGKVHRKEYGLELFRQGLAPRILFSVGRFEIRRFSKMALPVPLDLLKLAQELSPPQRHYFVGFQGQEVRVEHVPPRRFGTLNEIEALARWLFASQEIRSALVISSGPHLRRIRMCCRSLLDRSTALAFLASPSSQSEQNSAIASAADDLLELFKLSVYSVLLKIR